MDDGVPRIDMDALCVAIHDSSYEHYHYLDLETGEVVSMSDYVDGEEAEALKDEIEENPERYRPIPRGESYEGYGDMADFIATLGDERLIEMLQVAIDGRGAFRRFKDVLARYPDERERWFGFKDDRVKERAIEWLEGIGVRLEDG